MAHATEPATARLADEGERAAYRAYDDASNPAVARVRAFYRNNHQHQTFDFVTAKKAQWLQFKQRQMTPWAALDYLNTLVDESDPDIELPQISHLLQTAEAIRADGHPDWFVLTGFVHDLGKVLCLFGEPQWAVVGDTFPVGCRPYSEQASCFPSYWRAQSRLPGRSALSDALYGIYEPKAADWTT